MVVIVEHGKIILDRKGRLQAQVAGDHLPNQPIYWIELFFMRLLT
jgi:hypothetical protein